MLIVDLIRNLRHYRLVQLMSGVRYALPLAIAGVVQKVFNHNIFLSTFSELTLIKPY